MRVRTPGRRLARRSLGEADKSRGSLVDVQCTSMKRYSAAQVRERLADVLNEAEQGIPIVIERRGVRYVLKVERPRRQRKSRSAIEVLDPAVAAGEWQWTFTAHGLRFGGRRRRRR